MIQKVVDALAAHVTLGDDPESMSDVFSVHELLPPFSQYPADVILGFVNASEQPVQLTVDIVSPDGGCTHRTRRWVNKDDVMMPALMGRTMLPMVAMPDGWSLRICVNGPVVAVCAHIRDHVVVDAALSTYQLPRNLLPPHPAASTKPFESGMLARLSTCHERVVQLPDLEQALEVGLRSKAAQAREKNRQSLIFQDLMESVWSPRRVSAGLVDIDS